MASVGETIHGTMGSADSNMVNENENERKQHNINDPSSGGTSCISNGAPAVPAPSADDDGRDCKVDDAPPRAEESDNNTPPVQHDDLGASSSSAGEPLRDETGERIEGDKDEPPKLQNRLGVVLANDTVAPPGSTPSSHSSTEDRLNQPLLVGNAQQEQPSFDTPGNISTSNSGKAVSSDEPPEESSVLAAPESTVPVAASSHTSTEDRNQPRSLVLDTEQQPPPSFGTSTSVSPSSTSGKASSELQDNGAIAAPELIVPRAATSLPSSIDRKEPQLPVMGDGQPSPPPPSFSGTTGVSSSNSSGKASSELQKSGGALAALEAAVIRAAPAQDKIASLVVGGPAGSKATVPSGAAAVTSSGKGDENEGEAAVPLIKEPEGKDTDPHHVGHTASSVSPLRQIKSTFGGLVESPETPSFYEHHHEEMASRGPQEARLSTTSSVPNEEAKKGTTNEINEEMNGTPSRNENDKFSEVVSTSKTGDVVGPSKTTTPVGDGASSASSTYCPPSSDKPAATSPAVVFGKIKSNNEYEHQAVSLKEAPEDRNNVALYGPNNPPPDNSGVLLAGSKSPPPDSASTPHHGVTIEERDCDAPSRREEDDDQFAQAPNANVRSLSTKTQSLASELKDDKDDEAHSSPSVAAVPHHPAHHGPDGKDAVDVKPSGRPAITLAPRPSHRSGIAPPSDETVEVGRLKGNDQKARDSLVGGTSDHRPSSDDNKVGAEFDVTQPSGASSGLVVDSMVRKPPATTGVSYQSGDSSSDVEYPPPGQRTGTLSTIEPLTDDDILCGRGRGYSSQHPRNKRMLDVINKSRVRYKLAGSDKAKKGAIVQEVIDDIKAAGLKRYLRRESGERSRFEEVSADERYNKKTICQFMREKKHGDMEDPIFACTPEPIAWPRTLNSLTTELASASDQKRKAAEAFWIERMPKQKAVSKRGRLEDKRVEQIENESSSEDEASGGEARSRNGQLDVLRMAAAQQKEEDIRPLLPMDASRNREEVHSSSAVILGNLKGGRNEEILASNPTQTFLVGQLAPWIPGNGQLSKEADSLQARVNASFDDSSIADKYGIVLGDPTASDVLFGQDPSFYTHIGNIQLRRIIQGAAGYPPLSPENKLVVSRRIVAETKYAGSRFLTRHKTSPPGLWYRVDEIEVEGLIFRLLEEEETRAMTLLAQKNNDATIRARSGTTSVGNHSEQQAMLHAALMHNAAMRQPPIKADATMRQHFNPGTNILPPDKPSSANILHSPHATSSPMGYISAKETSRNPLGFPTAGREAAASRPPNSSSDSSTTSSSGSSSAVVDLGTEENEAEEESLSGPTNHKKPAIHDGLATSYLTGLPPRLASPSPHDVICGRGRGNFRHPGNRHMLKMFWGVKEKYSTSTKSQKTMIGREIVEDIESRGGRFLTRVVNGWEEVEKKTVLRKVCHGIRDIPNDPEMRKRSIVADELEDLDPTKPSGTKLAHNSPWLASSAPPKMQPTKKDTPALVLPKKTGVANASIKKLEEAKKTPTKGPANGQAPKKPAGRTPGVVDLRNLPTQLNWESAPATGPAIGQTPKKPAPVVVDLRSLVPTAINRESTPATGPAIGQAPKKPAPVVVDFRSLPGAINRESIALDLTRKAAALDLTMVPVRTEREKLFGMASTNQHDLIERPTGNDVLLGRGKGFFQHSGNQRMLKFITENSEEYKRQTKLGKSAVVRSVYYKVRSNGSRFLKRVNGDGSRWGPVPESEALQKVSHGIRDYMASVERLKNGVRKRDEQGKQIQRTTPSTGTVEDQAANKQSTQTDLVARHDDRRTNTGGQQHASKSVAAASAPLFLPNNTIANQYNATVEQTQQQGGFGRGNARPAEEQRPPGLPMHVMMALNQRQRAEEAIEMHQRRQRAEEAMAMHQQRQRAEEAMAMHRQRQRAEQAAAAAAASQGRRQMTLEEERQLQLLQRQGKNGLTRREMILLLQDREMQRRGYR